jgi:phosphinothricin acetyltransferase
VVPSPETVTVDVAAVDDLPQIVDIYNHVAAHSIANFNTRPATVRERLGWFHRHSATGPHRILIARRGTMVLGYAASSAYRPDHDAFRETVEVSISLHHTARRQGIGTLLYTALFDQLSTAPVHVALAGIALPNDASVALHRKFGFNDVGTYREYAVKNGQYISSLWMERLFH